MSEQAELCVSSRLTNLSTIADFVVAQARLAGMDEEQVFAVQMAVDEACTNAMEHAYAGKQDGEVRVCCSVEDDALTVSITDQGEPFDPSLVPVPDVSAPLETRSIGGLGLFFMHRLMDSVEFQALAPKGNQIVMRKHRKAGG